MASDEIKKIVKDNLFYNYLYDLNSSKYNFNNSPICLWGTGNLLHEAYNEMKEHHKGSTWNLIQNKLNISSQRCRTFYYWLKNENPIPLDKLFNFLNLWSEICNKSEKEKECVLKQIFSDHSCYSVRRGKKVKLPKELTSDLAYTLGYLAGDGSLLDLEKEKLRTGDYEFRISITSGSKKMLNIVGLKIKDIFDIDGNFYTYKKRNAYEYYLSSKVIYLFLTQICDLPNGKKTNNLRVPKIIFESNQKQKAAFIAGFFDSDGWATIKSKKIGFAQSHNLILKDIKRLLDDLKISSRPIYKLKHGFEFSIRWNSLNKFIDLIPSLNINKSMKLNEIMKNVNKKAYT